MWSVLVFKTKHSGTEVLKDLQDKVLDVADEVGIDVLYDHALH